MTINNDDMGSYGKLYKMMFDISSELESNDDIKIPMAVMIGNQSSGKSSLVNAIVGKDLMATGAGQTKTRRPTNLFLSQGNHRCFVAGTKIEVVKSFTSARWHDPQTKVVTEGIVLKQGMKGTIMEIDKDADAAVQFKGTAQQQWVLQKDFPNTRIASTTGLKETTTYRIGNKVCKSDRAAYAEIDRLQSECHQFSDNPIDMQLTGPDLPTILFVDMPGIVATDEGKVVDAMVKKAIQNERSLIIVVKKAVDDADTASAVAMAKEVDPEGRRTIMVHMKMDVTESSDHRHRVELQIQQQQYNDHGICLRNGDDFLTVEGERTFFKQQFPKLSPEHCGRRTLVQNIEPMLVDLIRKNIPALKKEIYDRKKEAEDVLNRVGYEPPDQTRMVDTVVSAWTRNAVPLVEEVTSIWHTKWHQQIVETTAEQLQSLKPVPLNIHRPVFFVGEKEFIDQIDSILLKWEGTAEEYAAQIKEALNRALTSVEHVLKTTHVSWADSIREKWCDTREEVFAAIRREMPRMIREKRAEFGFGTTNHYLTACFGDEITSPKEVEHAICTELAVYISSQPSANNEPLAKRQKLVDKISEIREKHHREHEEAYAKQNLQEQQTTRVHAMIKAYIKVLRKTVVDNTQTGILNHVVMEAVRGFPKTLKDAASTITESPATIRERVRALDQKERMDKILKILRDV